MFSVIDSRVNELRRKMEEHQLDAVIIPSSDPHQSEYVADHWQERAWVSGFTGSAGLVVVTQKHAGVWTDSRYYLQAEIEIRDSEFVLHKMPDQFSFDYLDFITAELRPGHRVVVNGWMFSRNEVTRIKEKLEKSGIELVYSIDLISKLWHDRPPLLNSEAEIHDSFYSGEDITEKLVHIRTIMTNMDVQHHFVSALDDIAWTLNLRGKDVAYNPVNIAYLVIGEAEAHLFIDEQKINPKTLTVLENARVQCHPYEKVINYINQLSNHDFILIDPDICSQMVFDAVPCHIKEGQSIPKKLKAIKNDIELNHIKNAMKKDAAALAGAFYEFEKDLTRGVVMTEYDLSNRLAFHRSQQPMYRGESFGSIVGYKENGAIIHYHPEKDTCKTISKEGILLVDSGAQYLDGTTDITRTFALDNPTVEQKNVYTRILKGMIALSNAVFPKGTMGVQLDAFARQYLWSAGMNYGHGTGHGVGFFLNVHEPPQGFTAGLSERGKTVLHTGMISSNEPGFYKQGEYGMRIENLIVCRESVHPGFLCFDTVTLYPFEHALIELSLLTDDEVEWINQYHQNVYHQTAPLLSEEVRDWFKVKCREL
jgi:Xaa-Pro aminopeptidase